MKRFLLAALLLTGCAHNVQTKVEQAANIFCPEIGAPAGSAEFAECYRITTNIVLQNPTLNIEQLNTKAKNFCAKNSEYEMCYVNALASEMAISNYESKQRNAFYSGLKNIGDAMQRQQAFAPPVNSNSIYTSCKQRGIHMECISY